VPVDAASIIVGWDTTKDWYLKGEPAYAPVTLSRQRVHMYGGLTEGSFDYLYSDRSNSDSFIALLTLLKKKYGRIIVIVDNASPHKSKVTKEFVESCNGDIILMYLPPYTPELNPVEGQWKSIRKCKGNTLFEDVDEMKDTITKMLENGECEPVKMFDWLL